MGSLKLFLKNNNTIKKVFISIYTKISIYSHIYSIRYLTNMNLVVDCKEHLIKRQKSAVYWRKRIRLFFWGGGGGKRKRIRLKR